MECLNGEAVKMRVVFRIGFRGGFWTDVMVGYWGAVTAGVMEGLNAGLRKTRTPVVWRIKEEQLLYSKCQVEFRSEII